MVNKEVGQRIMDLRYMNHYSREELAEMISISEKFLFEIENGRKGFSANTLTKISNALGVSCDYILFGKQNESIASEKTIAIIEQFDADQRSKLQSILLSILELCKNSD